tara:strand:+ start:3495 stop:3758 length:264 start_codon:yes stop_codon:yes gene_type:complete
MTQNEFSIKIRDIIGEELGLRPGNVSEFQTLEELGLDSLDLVQLSITLEHTFDLEDLDMHLSKKEIKTVGDLIRAMDNLMPQVDLDL